MGVIAKLALAVLFAAFSAVPAYATFVWNENNAGSLPATAEDTQGFGVLTQINGHLDYDNNTQLWGVDMYSIYITDATAFSARTEAGDSNASDPALYLFDSFGRGVYMNNDNSGSDFQSTLPSGSVFGPTAPGLYYLAIAWGFSDPLSSDSIFDLNQFFDTTGVYGPTGPGGADPVTAWNTTSAPGNFDLPSNYTIDLVGTVPEPGTVPLLLLAAAGLVGLRWRRRLDA